MKEKKRSELSVLLGYAGNYKRLTFLGMFLSAVAMVMGMLPYVCIWLAARDLIRVAPNWSEAKELTKYGWMAFGFSFGGIVVYFAALMCTHLAAFRTAANIRKQGVAHMMKAPLGFFDNYGSGFLRNRLDGGAAETETLLAHNLADVVGTAAMFVAMVVLMFVFDWRMGCACLLAAVISVIAMFSMMGGKNAKLMMEYQTAQDVMSKAGTEYVRGIPVVKVFQQTVYSFKAFKAAIEDYSGKAERYTGGVCRVPQSVNLTATEGVFIFLVPVALLIAPAARNAGSFSEFITNFAFYAVFSAIVSTAASLIPRFWDVSSGAVEVGGVNVKDVEPHVLMDRVAFVFQNTRLFKTSILANVRAARPNASREEVLAALHAAQCDDVIEKLPNGIDTLIGSEGTYLSGGEQQRVALARAILKDAPIIVLDEATAFADPENETLIQKALKTLTEGRTVIMIAHRLSTVVGADKIVVLDHGCVVEEGTHDALSRAGGLYERMWKEYNQAVAWKIASGKEGA